MQYWMAASTGTDRSALEWVVEEIKAQVPKELVVMGVD
jgi:hypothetical protein